MQDNHTEKETKTSLQKFARSLSPVIFVLFLLFSYWMYGYRPIASFPRSSVDDGLYLRHANAFVNWVCGNNPRWLGDYDCFLFAKSPLYGVFLGILNLLCIPVRVGEFILLFSIPYLFSAACRPVLQLRGWGFYACAALLVWLPVLPSDIHLQRMGLQGILSSGLIVASIGLVLRWGSTLAEQLRWGCALGILFSLNYLNREEAAWVGMLVLFSLLLLAALSKRGGHFSWRQIAAVSLSVIACSLPLIILVCSLNFHSYGVFQTTIRRSTAFTAAYQRLTSLEPEFHKRYIPISRNTRFRAYELSPTFGKLKEVMEGHSTYWVAGIPEHSAINGYTADDNEFFVSNYEFALEYAASVNGATSAVETERFFAAIDRELSQAIKAGSIRAGMHGPAILAAPVQGDPERIIRGWWASIQGLFTLKFAGLGWGELSAGDEPELQRVSLFAHSSLMPEPTDGIHYKLRLRPLEIVNRLLRIIYPGSIAVLLGIAVFSYVKKRELFYRITLSAIIPVLALAMFSFTMAVVDTLGFPFLGSMAYNNMGYYPVSVLCAFTLAVVLAHFRSVPPTVRAA